MSSKLVSLLVLALFEATDCRAVKAKHISDSEATDCRAVKAKRIAVKPLTAELLRLSI